MRDERGAAMIVILIALAIAGLVAWLAISRYTENSVDLLADPAAPLDGTRRARTIADMQAIGRSIVMMQADKGSYPANFAQLEAAGYWESVPAADGWGNAWVYTTGARGFTLTSLGSDGAAGPAPPSPWTDGSYASDLIMENGQLTQAPTSR